jgi:hypothetical protein
VLGQIDSVGPNHGADERNSDAQEITSEENRVLFIGYFFIRLYQK